MKCEHCGRQEANFFYKSNINGRVKEVHLCGHCAKELGYDRNMNLGGWMNDLFDMFSPAPLLSSGFSFPGENWLMPSIHAMLRDSEEEETAAPEAKTTVLLSEKEEEDLSRTRRLNALREELRQAVEGENYERAIELRDEIRRLDQAV